MAKDTVHEVNVVVEAMTDSAIGIAPVRKGKKQSKEFIWLPLSQVETHRDDYRIGDNVRVEIPEWLLIAKDLEFLVDE